MIKYNLVTESFFSKEVGNGLVAVSSIAAALSIYRGIRQIMSGKNQDRDYAINQIKRSRKLYSSLGISSAVKKLDNQIYKIQNMTDEEYRSYMYKRGGINIIASVILPPLMVILSYKYFNKK